MSVRDYIFNNFSWKVVSVLAATLIWLTIHSSIQGTIKTNVHPVGPGSSVTLNLPIIVATAAEDSHVFRISPHAVDVTLAGDAERIAQLKGGDVDAFVNLIDVAGARRLRKKVQVRVPHGVSIVRIEPGDVSVEMIAEPESPIPQKPNLP